MGVAALSVSVSAPAPVAVAAPVAPHPAFFHQLLSELNPLQYVPVVGTIYRAVTGDTIPEAARMTGSLVFSGLTGGPVGVAMNAGTVLVEHLTGIDPDAIGTRLLERLGLAGGGAKPAGGVAVAGATVPAVAVPGASEPGATVVAARGTTTGATMGATMGETGATDTMDTTGANAGASGAVATAWSPSQLAAYGVTRSAEGTLTRGAVSGADVLNGMELARLTGQAGAEDAPTLA